MGHDLAELTTGLASRVNNLAVLESGPNCRKLLEQQDRLTKLSMLAIVKDLNAEQANYKACIKCLNEAIDYIGNGDKKIANVAKAIQLTAKAADSVEKIIKAVAKYV
jgi:hypothetical protein